MSHRCVMGRILRQRRPGALWRARVAFGIRSQPHLSTSSRHSGHPSQFPGTKPGDRDGRERPNSVAGLLEKRGVISGQIEHYQGILKELIIDLDHVDHTIRLFAPDCDVAPARSKPFPPRHQAFKGELQRFVLGELRAATEPLTSLEIGIEMVKCRGLDPNNPRAVSLMRKRVGAACSSSRGWCRTW